MASEQLCRRRVGARTDLFALGVLGWRLYTGDLPFEGTSTAERLESIRRGPARTSRAHHEAALDVLRQALAWSASERPASAHELARALACVAPPADSFSLAAWGDAHVRRRLAAPRVLTGSRSSALETTLLTPPPASRQRRCASIRSNEVMNG